MWPNPQDTVHLVIFAEEILKLFLRSESYVTDRAGD